LSKDLTGLGQPLDKPGLFRLVADEAFRDGVIEDVENHLLRTLTRFLRLPQQEVVEIARHSRENFEAGKLGASRPLEPGALYREVLLYSMSDGVIQPLEKDMLRGLRILLSIPEEEHEMWVTGLLDRQGSFLAELPESERPVEVSEDLPSWSELQHMVGEAASLAKLALKNELTEWHQKRVLDLVESFRAAFRQPGMMRTQAFLATANLAAAVAVLGELDRLEAAVLELLELDRSPFRQQMVYQTLLVNSLKGERARHGRSPAGATRKLAEHLERMGKLGNLGRSAVQALDRV
jgi:hypothetical protein